MQIRDVKRSAGGSSLVADSKSVGGDIFSNDVINWRIRSFVKNIETMALPERVGGCAAMLADNVAGNVKYVAGRESDFLGQKIAHINFTDKANTSAIFFVSSGEIIFFGEGANLRFLEVSQRK